MIEEFEQALIHIEDEEAAELEKLIQAEPALLSFVQEDASLLHHAAAAGSLSVLEVLLENGANPDGPDACSSTPLQWAAGLNLVEVLKQLIDFGADPEKSDAGGEGGTALVHALFYGHSEAADFLATRAIVPSNLRVAAGLGRVDLMEQFFDELCNLTDDAGKHRQWYRANEEFPEKPTRDDPQEILDEALCYACFNNRLDAARFLLERGANPNAKPFYATALHFAVAKDNIELVDILMEAGADLFIEDDNHRSTPQGWAEWGCQDKMSDYLLSIMADSDLVHSVASGDSNKVQKLISQSSKRELMGEKGKQALLEAIESGNEEIEKILRDGGARLCLSSAAAIGSIEDVEYLIGQGLSPNSTMTVSVPVPGSHAVEKEISALLLAAVNRHENVCRKLLDAGAKVDLYVAAALNMVSEVQGFIDGGIEVDAVDQFGRTALHRAIQGDAVDVIRFLLDKGADPERSADFFSYGPRAVHVAAQAGASRPVLELLLAAGVDLNGSSNLGTPLECALRENQDETAAILKEFGAESEEG